MIRMDFFDGGFPINNKIPAICVLDNFEIKPAYTYFDLRQIILTSTVKQCFGVWIGKINSDVFILNPELYKEIYPPEEHKDIDHASNIDVFLEKGCIFSRINYTVRDLTVETKDEAVFTYVKRIGKKFMTKFC